MSKYVYFFGNNNAEGDASMIDLLGSKGAGLAEMSKLGLPVPPGFTITTEVCRYFGEHKSFPDGLKEQVETAVIDLEKMTGQKLSDRDNPLTVSVRSGGSRSMPGMMDTMLNVNTDLWACIESVFLSWNNPRAVEYRRIEKIPSNTGTAATIQAMVFGNKGEDSATGVAFTRNPGTGENQFYGEYLLNAQGEDVVAGTHTPGPVNAYSRSGGKNPTLEELMPDVYRELLEHRARLEKHYRDMLDIEFTIQKGKLYILQCRVGKRNGTAALRIATEMLRDGLITIDEAWGRVTKEHLAELKAPIIDPKAEGKAKVIACGLPAGPGGATGRAVFSPETAIKWAKKHESVILVREETSPNDVEGMYAAQGTLTQKGGMTSHAATVARGWGKCCIVGCNEIEVGLKQFKTKGKIIHEGDWITLDGTQGLVYEGQLRLKHPALDTNPYYHELMLRKRHKK